MFLSRFFLTSLIIHVLLSFFIIQNFNQVNQKKEIKYTNIINSEIIGIIDQNSSKVTKEIIKDDLNSKNDDKKIKNLERIKDFNFEQVEDFLKNNEEEKKINNAQQKNQETQKAQKSDEEIKISKDEVKKDEAHKPNPPLKEKKENIQKIHEKPQDLKKNQEKKKEIKKNKENKNIAKNPEKKPKKKNLEKNDEIDKNAMKNLKNQLQKAEKILNSEIEQKNRQNINSSENFGAQSMATLGAYIKTKIIQCWKIPMTIGMISDQKVYVIVRIRLDQNGEIINFKVLNDSQYIHNEFFEKIKQSAIEAIQNCSPISGLQVERYEDWREIELIFDPNKI